MGHKIVSGQVIDTPDTTTPSGHNDRAAHDAHTYEVDPNAAAARVLVSEEQWADMVADHGAQFYALTLVNEHSRLSRETTEVKLALILVGARAVSADPKAFQKGSGAWHKGKIAEFLGVPKSSRSLATEVATGVVALVEGGAELFGEPTPEVVALALAYRDKSRAQKQRSSSKGKNAPKSEGEGSTSEEETDTREGDAPLAVADLVAALEAAHKVIDQLGADRDADEWADVSALVDSLSDKVYA